ncbi:MAG: hypothetical protein ACE5IQ_00295 [Candidatus Methylomirabilales bacterium]
MKLKRSANAAREHINEMIVSGTILLDTVTSEYLAAKDSGAFAEKEHIPRWQDQYIDWFHKCLAVLQEVFPTPVEAIRVKNAQPASSFKSGANIKWSGLTNDIKAKLAALESVINAVKDYSVEMTEELFIEDIDSFAKARDINSRQAKRFLPLDLSRDQIRTFLEEITGEPFDQPDGDAETKDAITSHVNVGVERLRAAFLLKGRGTKGKLTVKKCGKTGDQIARLVEAAADLYTIVHVNDIDEGVIQNLKGKVRSLNDQGKTCRMCIIDGTDIARILLAYGKIPQ